MHKKKIILIASCIIMVIGIIMGVKLVKDNSYKKSFSEELEVALAGSAYYNNRLELVDFMQPNRKVLLYMTSDFNDLTREEKHIYMEDVLAEKVKDTFKDWITEDKKYNNIPINDLTFMDIGIVLKCDDSEYLKAPASAEFPTYGNSGVTITCAGNLYTVKGYVKNNRI